MCARMYVARVCVLLFFKSVGIKVAAGLCGLLTSSSAKCLGCFCAMSTSAVFTHTQKANGFKAKQEVSFWQMLHFQALKSRQVASKSITGKSVLLCSLMVRLGNN